MRRAGFHTGNPFGSAVALHALKLHLSPFSGWEAGAQSGSACRGHPAPGGKALRTPAPRATMSPRLVAPVTRPGTHTRPAPPLAFPTSPCAPSPASSPERGHDDRGPSQPRVPPSRPRLLLGPRPCQRPPGGGQRRHFTATFVSCVFLSCISADDTVAKFPPATDSASLPPLPAPRSLPRGPQVHSLSRSRPVAFHRRSPPRAATGHPPRGPEAQATWLRLVCLSLRHHQAPSSVPR